MWCLTTYSDLVINITDSTSMREKWEYIYIFWKVEFISYIMYDMQCLRFLIAIHKTVGSAQYITTLLVYSNVGCNINIQKTKQDNVLLNVFVIVFQKWKWSFCKIILKTNIRCACVYIYNSLWWNSSIMFKIYKNYKQMAFNNFTLKKTKLPCLNQWHCLDFRKYQSLASLRWLK